MSPEGKGRAQRRLWPRRSAAALGLFLSAYGARAGGGEPPAVQAHAAAAPPPVSVRTGRVAGHPDWGFHELTPDPAGSVPELLTPPSGQPGGATLASMAAAVGTAGGRPLAAVNGAFFDRRFLPVGWVYANGVELHRPNPRAKGAGALVLLPAAAGTAGGDRKDPRPGFASAPPPGWRAWIGRLAKAPAGAFLALQNSPLLVLDGRRISGLDTRLRAARTVACLKADATGDRLAFIQILAAIGQGPTLEETSTLLLQSVADGGFGCRTALNLDGGPSTGNWYGPELTALGHSAAPPVVPIGHGLLFLARPAER